MGIGEQEKQQAIQRIFKTWSLEKTECPYHIKLPDESDDSLLLHDVAGVEWGGGVAEQDRGSWIKDEL